MKLTELNIPLKKRASRVFNYSSIEKVVSHGNIIIYYIKLSKSIPIIKGSMPNRIAKDVKGIYITENMANAYAESFDVNVKHKKIRMSKPLFLDLANPKGIQHKFTAWVMNESFWNLDNKGK